MSFSLDDLKKKKNNKLGQLEVLKNGLQTINNSNSLENRINSIAARKIDSISTELKNNATELIIIIDKSGSRGGSERATILGVEKLIKEQKESGYNTKVTIILFDHESHEVCRRLDIKNVGKFNYYAEGGTALYDVLCNKLATIKDEQLKKLDIDPEKTVCVITTDGHDEDSILYSLNDTQKLINECKNIGWKFIFLGAMINAKESAKMLGIDESLAIDFRDDEIGVLTNFEAVGKILDSVRATGEVNKNWADDIKKHNHLALGSGDDEGPKLSLKGGK